VRRGSELAIEERWYPATVLDALLGIEDCISPSVISSPASKQSEINLSLMPQLNFLSNVLLIVLGLLLDTLRFIRISPQPRCALVAENLFLRSSGMRSPERNRIVI
jgi:hypothetical protein